MGEYLGSVEDLLRQLEESTIEAVLEHLGLNEKQRRMVLLYLQGYKVKEIAQMFSVSESYVYKVLHKAFKSKKARQKVKVSEEDILLFDVMKKLEHMRNALSYLYVKLTLMRADTELLRLVNACTQVTEQVLKYISYILRKHRVRTERLEKLITR